MTDRKILSSGRSQLPVRGIISDLGRVIVDFDHHVCTRKLSKLSGKPEEEIHEYIYMSKMDTRFDSGKITGKEFYKFIETYLKTGISFSEFSAIFSKIFTLMSPTIEFYRELKECGLKFCLLSNTNELHYSYCKKEYPELKLFESTVLSYKTGVMKPHPRIYIEAVNKLRLKPQECVYIDDIPEYAEAANLLEINGIRFKNIAQVRRELEKLGVKL